MIDLDAIEARIRDCKTYNFGLWNADKLAHEDAPAMLTELRHLRVIASGNQGAIVNSIIERTRHEATDDEREALAEVIEVLDTHGQWPVDQITDAVLAAGYLHSEPQGEPSDAKVRAALSEWFQGIIAGGWTAEHEARMRGALRAAGEVRR